MKLVIVVEAESRRLRRVALAERREDDFNEGWNSVTMETVLSIW